ncbi:MAG: hypothetical protein Q8942_20450 [Bacillota bacterium]|nr:hypothetical protein [Bacillota bacterium]
MLKNVKVFIMGFTCASLIIGSTIGVIAVSSDINITAVLSSSIKLKLNGKDWTPKDSASGEYFKPISYNGRTYLPLRAVVEDAAKMPVDYDAATKTIWIGGKTEVAKVSESAYYEDYYGTIVTTDTAKLTTPAGAYKWGITNDKDAEMESFTCYVKPNGNYKHFRTSIFLDSSAKDSLTINFRKDTYNGDVIKSVIVKPGETLEDIDIDIGGIDKFCIESSIRINHGTIKRIIYGEPTLYNGTLESETSSSSQTNVVR